MKPCGSCRWFDDDPDDNRDEGRCTVPTWRTVPEARGTTPERDFDCPDHAPVTENP